MLYVYTFNALLRVQTCTLLMPGSSSALPNAASVALWPLMHGCWQQHCKQAVTAHFQSAALLISFLAHLQHPLCHPDAVLCGTASNVLHISHGSKLLQRLRD
jgi:hypothetical protein